MVAYCRTRSRSPGTLNPNDSVGWPARARPTNTVPGGLAVLRFGTGHPGDGEPDVGLEDPAGALGHGPGRLLGDHRSLGHAEDGELDLRGVGHHRATEPVTGPGHVDQAGRRQSAGQGLGQPEGQPAGHDRRGHGILDGLLVHAEHHVPGRGGQDPPDLGLLGIQQHRCRLLVPGPHRDPDLDPLDPAGQEGDGGRPCRSPSRVPPRPPAPAERRGGRCARPAPRPARTRSSPRSATPGWR